MNSVKMTLLSMSFVAQWMERRPGVRVVMGSISVGDSDFSLSHARAMLNISSFTFNYRAQNSPSSFTYHHIVLLAPCPWMGDRATETGGK